MKWLAFCGSLMIASACTEHTRESLNPKLRDLPSNTADAKKDVPDYQGLKVYQGTIPCADCPMTKQRLALKGDSTGIFRLTETFVDATEDGDAVLVTTGEWKKYSKQLENGKKQSILWVSEGSLKDSTRVWSYEIKDKKIVQLDSEGKLIPNPGNYTLKLIYTDR